MMFTPMEKNNVTKVKDFELHKWKGIDNRLDGKDCFLLGSGGSVRDYDLSLMNGKFVLAMNHSAIRYPECDAVMFSDKDYYEGNHSGPSRKEFLLNYEGMIFCGKKAEWWNDNRSNVCIFEYNNTTPQLKISDGLYNSGLTGIAALNLAIIMGAGRIFLLGYDFDINAGTKQIEESNPEAAVKYYSNPKWINWRIRKLAAFMPWHDRIFNCSPISALTYFQGMDYTEAVK